jgi:hypothetical protein
MITEIKVPEIEYLNINKVVIEVKDSYGHWEKKIFTNMEEAKKYIRDIKMIWKIFEYSGVV